MNPEETDMLHPEIILENLTHTLLYEGYALYPYHRSAIKNQKPVPFGVVFPQVYNSHHEHAHSMMQTQCLLSGSDQLMLDVSIRFLQLKKIELLKNISAYETMKGDFVPADYSGIKEHFYESGWQTVERRLDTGNLSVSYLVKRPKVITLSFNKVFDSNYMYDENGTVTATQLGTVSGINGCVVIAVAPVENLPHAFRITVRITNTTLIENADVATRDEALAQSFLSTHIILKASHGEFASHQNPGEIWKNDIVQCQNLNTWPILIDDNNSILLSSPIILYDHPRIHPQSSGNLFDSTEIEEALLLHVSVLSDEEKNQIGESDEKLQTMLNKVSRMTPGELMGFHSVLRHDRVGEITSEKKSEA